MLTDKELAELISRLDTITTAVHQLDVAHLDLIGYPEDIFALEKHVLELRTHTYRDGMSHTTRITPATIATQLPHTKETP